MNYITDRSVVRHRTLQCVAALLLLWGPTVADFSVPGLVEKYAFTNLTWIILWATWAIELIPWTPATFNRREASRLLPFIVFAPFAGLLRDHCMEEGLRTAAIVFEVIWAGLLGYWMAGIRDVWFRIFLRREEP